MINEAYNQLLNDNTKKIVKTSLSIRSLCLRNDEPGAFIDYGGCAATAATAVIPPGVVVDEEVHDLQVARVVPDGAAFPLQHHAVRPWKFGVYSILR